ncbi:hypothetical protein F7Q99_36610 [Streptomyces kaniharaensis]|uniref:Uncharacterized protein n=1 Tax=Streptomyces kaniharaensis TaxID=212423 RepID=A0A6N7L5D0_9ACTN|nr:hypothetical protein [Streptomyces kaniharaensis]MQS17564.1 hypothetical protein [Streptomyces kaniharaensis]
MQSVTARFTQLQHHVAQQRGAVETAEPGSPGFDETLAALLTATDALLDHASRIPELREAPARRTTEVLVLWVSRGYTTLTGLTAAAVIPGWIAWGWLILLLPLLLAGLTAGWKVQPVRAGRPHRGRRASAVLAAVSALMLSAVAFEVLSAWFLTAAAVCAAVAFFLGLPDEPAASTAKGNRK